MWWLPLAMLGAGAAKGALDQRQAGRQRKAEAEIARWSPWTGMQAQRVSDGPGVLGGAMQGGAAGIGMMQGLNSMNSGQPIGNISDTTPGYTPNGSSTAAGESMMAAGPEQSNNLSLFEPGKAPVGYEWMQMNTGKPNPYNLFGSPTQQMLAQK